MINFEFYDKPKKYSLFDKAKRSTVKRLLQVKPISSLYFRKNKKNFQEIFFGLTSNQQEFQKLLYFHHDLGGGSDLYLKNKIGELKNSNYILVAIYKPNLAKINLQIAFQSKYTSVLIDNLEELLDLLSQVKINNIYINQIVLFPEIEKVFELTKKLTGKEARVTMLVHDFYSVCCQVFLIKDNGDKCDIITGKESCSCDPRSGGNFQKWQKFLEEQASEIICFSESSKRILTEVHPKVSNKIQLIPHQVPYLRKVEVNEKNQTINIATIGLLNRIKGYEIIKEMSEIILKNNLPVTITVIGKIEAKKDRIIKSLGKYRRDNLPKIIEDNQVDIVFISSICPETFSYSTHEAMMMGIKVACFDLGAQGEYVKKYPQGLIISKIEAKTALDEIIKFCNKK